MSDMLSQINVNTENIAIVYPKNDGFADIYIFNLHEERYEQAKISYADKLFIEKIEKFLVERKINICIVCIRDEIKYSEPIYEAIKQRFSDKRLAVHRTRYDLNQKKRRKQQ